MERIKTLLLFSTMVLLSGLLSVEADDFMVTGAGSQLVEHDLTDAEMVGPGGSLVVTITNGSPGYTNFLVALFGDDTFIDAEHCDLDAPAAGCMVCLDNEKESTTADLLAVLAIGGRGRFPSADVTHVVHAESCSAL